MSEMTKTEKIIRVICVVLTVVMLLSILPAFILCFYTFPCPGDDYFYAYPLLQGLQTQGISAVITAPLQFAAERYINWQGSFLSCVMFALNPMVFAFDLYRVAMFLMNLLFVLSVLMFSRALFRKTFKLKAYLSFLLGALMIFAFYHCVPFFNLFEICFWYTGAVFYFIPLSFFLLFIALLLRLNRKKDIGRKTGWMMAGLIVLAVFLAFSNLTTAVSTWSGLAILLLLSLIKKHRLTKELAVIFGVFTAVLLVNALSPGYIVRYDHGIENNMVDVQTANIFKVLEWSFKLGTKNLRDFAFIAPVVGGSLIAAPLMVKQAKGSRGVYANPILLLVATYLVFIAQYAPFLYALGDMQYGRIIAYRFFLAQMLYIVNIANFAAFAAAKLDIKRVFLKFAAVIVMLAGLYFVYHSFKVWVVPKSHIRTMIETYVDGTIPTYIEEKNERIKILEDDSIKTVVFEPLTETDVCFSFDYTDNNLDSLINRNLADYYNKLSVIVKESE